MDRSHLGIYHTLADLVEENLKRSDYATAAKISRILKVAWDRAEIGLRAKSRHKWGAICAAMDEFIKSIHTYKKVPPDPTKSDVAYHRMCGQLKQADAEKLDFHILTGLRAYTRLCLKQDDPRLLLGIKFTEAGQFFSAIENFRLGQLK